MVVVVVVVVVVSVLVGLVVVGTLVLQLLELFLNGNLAVPVLRDEPPETVLSVLRALLD